MPSRSSYYPDGLAGSRKTENLEARQLCPFTTQDRQRSWMIGLRNTSTGEAADAQISNQYCFAAQGVLIFSRTLPHIYSDRDITAVFPAHTTVTLIWCLAVLRKKMYDRSELRTSIRQNIAGFCKKLLKLCSSQTLSSLGPVMLSPNGRLSGRHGTRTMPEKQKSTEKGYR
ncbi:hypothetical protein K461DRAFT_109618 [Myriangium duriaei CBS 260.36]|uniref:Uncharacterized protein n=1 Tax=Myriangium duriaei CBS 260.36 TaxID=1168546 RepID=A0A9P4J518_9PEZI|nr:hypothetical protein K461DRAFT_109618 [Myriangium duriaei CBS 260.36]